MNKNLYMIPKNYLPLFPDAFIGPFYSGLGFALFSCGVRFIAAFFKEYVLQTEGTEQEKHE